MRTIDQLSGGEIEEIHNAIIVLMEVSHAHSIDRGFAAPDSRRNPGELIALMHSELSEALEAFRMGNGPSDKISDFLGLEEELADLIIRVCDMAGEYQLNLARALITKLHYNRSRPYKHGKKF